MNAIHRRQFIKHLGISAASLPFLLGLPSLGLASPVRPRQRLVVMFSPNGTIPPAFWPYEVGACFYFFVGFSCKALEVFPLLLQVQ